MRLKSELAHDLVEQFVEWHRRNGIGPRGYQSASAYVHLVPAQPRMARARRDYTLSEAASAHAMRRQFNDSHARLIDRLLINLKQNRPQEYDVLMFYYFCGQNQQRTAKHFKMRPEHVSNLVNTAVAYLDGQLRVLVA